MNRVRCARIMGIFGAALLVGGCCVNKKNLPPEEPSAASIITAPVEPVAEVIAEAEAEPAMVEVEDIVAREELKRKFAFWKADRLMSEGLKALRKKDYLEAIDKLGRAEKILRQFAASHAPSMKRLESCRRHLGRSHRDYALQLLERGRASHDVRRLEEAETQINAAINFDECLKPEAQDFLKTVKNERFWAQLY